MTDVQPLPPGATYVRDFVSLDAAASIVARVDAQPWITDLKRRVQHYGYRYYYRARTVNADAYLGELPVWLAEIGRRLVHAGFFDRAPDQAIVNEYQSGQGIAAHVDCEPCFSDTIASLSLLSTCEMRFEDRRNREQGAQILEPRSVLVLKGPARFEWTHAIPARKSDVIDGRRVARTRRLSLTFREVIAR